ncbi:MAG: ROK family protein, partial [Firmicutes bacterium]|nr:ROK family protein [Bacillota bacterium]
MKNEHYCILDIGGTKLLALLVDSRRQVLYKETFPTISSDSITPLIDQICDTVERAIQQLEKGTSLARLGICIAAFVDYQTGDLYGAPNLKIREKVALKDILYQRLDLPIIIENDANAAVLGEVKYGAAIGARNAIYVTVSTGIGGGLFLNGELYRGNNSFAGEIGHLKLFGQNLCGCGMRGCLESIASGGAMGRIARKRISPQMSCATLFEESRRENVEAMRIVNEGLEYLGLTFS